MSTQAVLRRRVAATSALVLAAFGQMGTSASPGQASSRQSCPSPHLPGSSRFRRRSGRLVALVIGTCLALGLLGALESPGDAASGRGGAACALTHAQTRTTVGGRSLTVARPTTVGIRCAGAIGETTAAGTPPLIKHTGPVMATPSAGDQVVVTPIFWEPNGTYSFTSSYKSLIVQYLHDLASASGRMDNVFGTVFEYAGSNGGVNYKMLVGSPIDDTNGYPTAGCTTNTGQVYADGTGYTTCLDDDQIIAETDAMVGTHSLPRGYGHLYVVFLPKHVESCFYPGNPVSQQCTINPTASAAYCAYHSSFTNGSDTVYANMPFPVYSSATGYSCTDENLGTAGQIQSPNGDVDADVEISPLSHEMAEAMTDPDGNAWYDSSGYENGDECAYIYETLSGTSGALYNQAVHGHHYLTQEEFSNRDYNAGNDGCLQGGQPVVPQVTKIAPASGAVAGGTQVAISGNGFAGTTSVRFGSKAATFTFIDGTHLKAKAPKGTAGTVDVTVTTSAGTSKKVAVDHFAYRAPKPVVTSVSPARGTHNGGTTVTIHGSGFVAGAAVRFGRAPGRSVKVVSSTKISVRSPKHGKGKVDVTVHTAGGISATGSHDHYRFT